MHIKSIKIKGVKRFSDLAISNLPATAQLVVMTGPNGCGKSSLFDAFKLWHWNTGGPGGAHDPLYHLKQGFTLNWNQLVSIDFHEPTPRDSQARKKIFYIRSAYRNEADFTIGDLHQLGSALDTPRVNRLIDNDASVSQNYQRLVSASIAGLYSGEYDSLNVVELRESFIGKVRESMGRVFNDLSLKGPGDPLQRGTFYFAKGTSSNFHYKNLSGGEKAAFDILLDLIIEGIEYDDTIFCIEAPDLHRSTTLQAPLLDGLVRSYTDCCTLSLGSHSSGVLRKARDLLAADTSTVALLDVHQRDLD